ncbi:hypothetical protein LSH36_33g08071 [Paralvinella palmiformis]|uniref:Uncharacterized protein n=1 Tax=Paralvinella palmiformis TaxID=53620 RepID=A0AAD9NG26_9ANNE|nr:hypothetical protein LSH36_33g08071 [Paralvinella palmiformis]
MKSVSSRNSAVKNMSVEEYNKLYHEMRERVISNIRTSDFDSGEYRPVPSISSENDAHSLNDMSTMSEREKKLMKLRLQAIRGQIDTPGVVSGWRLVEMYKNRPEVGDEQFDLAAIMSRLFAKKQTKSRHSSPTRRQRTKATSSDRARQSPSHERQ